MLLDSFILRKRIINVQSSIFRTVAPCTAWVPQQFINNRLLVGTAFHITITIHPMVSRHCLNGMSQNLIKYCLIPFRREKY